MSFYSSAASSSSPTIHLPPPYLATATSSFFHVVAPPIQYASPYLDSQFADNQALLVQIHPRHSLSEEAQILILRLQDRIAHYLLALDYYGKESEWASRNRLEFTPRMIGEAAAAASQPALTDIPISSTVAAWCRSSLDFAFPRAVGSESLVVTRESIAPDIEKHALNERLKAFRKLEALNVDQTLDQIVAINIQSAERWISDFQIGVRITESQANSMKIDALSSSSNTKSTRSAARYDLRFKLSLAAYIEYITAELLEWSGNAPWSVYRRVIQGIDVWRSVWNDPELNNIINLLPIDWRVTEAHSPLSSVSLGSNQPTAMNDGLLARLESEWRKELTKVQTDSLPCWFNQPSEVQSVARRFARGELRDSSVSLSLQQYHCRPYRYWGYQHRSLFRESRRDHIGVNGYSYVSFLLEDGAGEEWHVMIEYEMSDAPHRVSSTPPRLYRGRFILLESGWEYAKFSTKRVNSGLNSKIVVTLSKSWRLPRKITNQHAFVLHAAHAPLMSAKALIKQQQILEDIKEYHAMLLEENDQLFPSVPSGVKLWHYFPSGTQLPISLTQTIAQKHDHAQEARMKQQQQQQHHEEGSMASTLDQEEETKETVQHAASASTSSRAFEREPFDPLAAIGCTASEPTLIERHFKTLLPRLLHITDYARYGPTLYLANQPQKIRHTFTVSLIDESMITNGITPLPSVLVSLIADYHTFDLPYLDREIKVLSPQSNTPRPSLFQSTFGAVGRAFSTVASAFGYGSNESESEIRRSRGGGRGGRGFWQVRNVEAGSDRV